MRKCKIIFIMGGPGSGKGAQCEKLAAKYGLAHLAPGRLLRAELVTNSERSRLIRASAERGEAAPSAVVLELLQEAMTARLGDARGFLISGFPRGLKQGEDFALRVRDPHLVICMDCSADTMTRRLLQRNPGGGALEDAAKVVGKRLETYYRACLPVLAHYEGRARLRKINAEGTPEEVFLQLCEAVGCIF